MKKKFAIATLGCKVNQFESASFLSDFRERGCEQVPFSSAADIYVINTCAVTARAGQQSRQLIRRAMRNNPGARIVVTGCYAQMAAEEIVEIVDNPVTIVGNGNKDLLVEEALGDSCCELSMLMGNIGHKKEICDLPVQRFSGRTRAFLRIQDGCNNFCSYCIVPYTRGRSRSLPAKAVFRQVEVFARQGYRELVITGINVGKYGLDLDGEMDIYTLLDTLCAEHPEMRIRLSSIEPTEINDRLLAVMTGRANFMPHLHIPLQSGDDRILAHMNRRYTVEVFVEAIRKVTAVLPMAAIGCDVLAGFPGEDEQAAENTRQLLARLPVTYLHVFPYSKRPGTPAATFTGQVAPAEKEERVRRLRELDEKKRQEFYDRQAGRVLQVLVERRHRQSGRMQGFSENYVPIRFRGPRRLAGSVVPVRLDRVEDGVPLGTLVDAIASPPGAAATPHERPRTGQEKNRARDHAT
ncbi:MAG TPA: tRNA (N(6)-L-threonylcarbamoyladenosine(37)-C(2))-methylthiotransferase MtaB [Desulfobulbus sp.]|nr:tRNA (N(6)-L-threonylcarbamoyladenosine(37)-C(2))-methylthiotransferase MtaB [Desulfobulbus sp.]